MSHQTIAIIGTGVMGESLASSIIGRKAFPARRVMLYDIDSKKSKRLAKKFQALHAKSLEEVSMHASFIVLAVKPSQFFDVAEKLRPFLTHSHVVVSFMAGVSLATLRKQLKKQKIVRVMPNIAVTVGHAMSVWISATAVGIKEQNSISKMLQTFGKQIRVTNERDIDVATAISGSGPAYVFYLAEQLEKAARALRFQPSMVRKLVSTTVYGAATMLLTSAFDAVALRSKVTSKGGTTEAAFQELKKRKTHQAFQVAFVKAFKRAQTLKKMYE